MISFNFNLRNPWSNEFKNFCSRAYDTPFKHHFIELEFYKDSTLLSFMFNWTLRQSHAGLDIDVGLLGYNVHFQFYDNRHWNSKEGRWYKYDEENGNH
jgi:hypothetical protein